MIKTEPFKIFQTYMGVKLHFESKSYDFMKYKGKSKNATPFYFNKRKDKKLFDYLGYKLQGNEVLPFLIANYMDGKTDMFKVMKDYDDAHSCYLKWQGRIDGVLYGFQTDMKKVQRFIENNELTFDDMFGSIDGSIPHIVMMLIQHEISDESFVMLDKCLGFINQLDKQSNILWDEMSLKYRKYSMFLSSDVSEYMIALREIFVKPTVEAV